MTLWEWWAGDPEDVDDDGRYTVGPCRTRDHVISAAAREIPHCAEMEIIEARSSTDAKYEGADIVPFLRMRNRETVMMPEPRA